MTTSKKHPPKVGNALFGPFATERIRLKREAGQHNAADLYRTTRNWLGRYRRGPDLRLRDITPSLVAGFGDYLRGKGLKVNSVNTYLSNLRVLYNDARRAGLVPESTPYPFAQFRLRRETPSPRALRGKTVEEIVTLTPRNVAQERAVDYCTFSYLACGMPFVDLAHLTTDNVRDGEIVYRRKKTGTAIRVGITPGMERLIRKYANPASPYLFPIMRKRASHEGYKSILRSYNAALKEIGNACLSQPVRLTSYVVRHTWATEALRKNTPISVISQALGHTSEKTTRFYLAALDQSELDKANRIVTGDIDRIVARAS